jgi:hypothetical protein
VWGFFYKTFSFLSFLFFIVCKFIVSFLTLEGGGKGQMGFLKLLYLLGQRRRRERVGGFSQGFFFKLKFYCLQKFCYIFVYFEGAGDAKGTWVLLEG